MKSTTLRCSAIFVILSLIFLTVRSDLTLGRDNLLVGEFFEATYQQTVPVQLPCVEADVVDEENGTFRSRICIVDEEVHCLFEYHNLPMLPGQCEIEIQVDD